MNNLNEKLHIKVKELSELNNTRLKKREREERLREFGKDISLKEIELMINHLKEEL